MAADSLDGLTVFMAVAEARNFRIAGQRLGVTASAVSQALRKLEERLGVSLAHRTTRSVSLTEAGMQLHERLRPAMEEIESAVRSVGQLSSTPRGKLRLLVGPEVDSTFAWGALEGFLKLHPDVTLDLVVSDAVLDLVALGFDAGIQLREVIDRDMVAVPVTGDIRMSVVGSPEYLERNGTPQHPRDLVNHQCLNWRRTAESLPYRWEFTETGPAEHGGGSEIVVSIPHRVLSTDSRINLGLARAWLGLTIAYESMVSDDVQRGTLVPVLEAFCTTFPGYYLYHPHRRQASAALRALIDHLRRQNKTLR